MTDPAGVRPTLVTYLAMLVLVLVPLALVLQPFAVSVATGAILAVLCYPLYGRLRLRFKPWISALSLTLGVVVLILTPVSLLMVGAFRQASSALGQVAAEGTPSLAELVQKLRGWAPAIDVLGSPSELHEMLADALSSVSSSASGWLLHQAQSIPQTILQLVIVVLSTYFLLIDGRRLINWIAEKLPLSRHIRQQLIASFRSATSAVVLASMAASSAQALLILVGFWLVGVPAAVLAAGATFVLAWVPPFGTLPVWGGAAIYLVSQGSPGRAVIVVILGLVVGIVDNVVRPLVLRGREAMHPMVSLLAILGGLGCLGVPGAFMGPLLASIAIAMLEIWPAVAAHCGIAVSGAGETVPEVDLDPSATAQTLIDDPPAAVPPRRQG